MVRKTIPPAPGALILERLPCVKARTGLSRSEIYRRVALGTFPAPVKLSASDTARASAWVGSEIDAFIGERIAARDRASA